MTKIQSTPLTLVEDDGWFTIEKAEHENEHRLIPDAYGASLWYSGRIADADVEGTAEHMLAIAQAIIEKRDHDERRCAVEMLMDCKSVAFYSPRNSRDGGEGVVLYADALALAHEIIEKLGQQS